MKYVVKRPLIRLRHLLPQQETAGGEGLSIGGIAENERLGLAGLAAAFAQTTDNAAKPQTTRQSFSIQGVVRIS